MGYVSTKTLYLVCRFMHTPVGAAGEQLELTVVLVSLSAVWARHQPPVSRKDHESHRLQGDSDRKRYSNTECHFTPETVIANYTLSCFYYNI